ALRRMPFWTLCVLFLPRRASRTAFHTPDKVDSARAYTLGLFASMHWSNRPVAEKPEFWNRCESL
ncbi:hypothetical protein, partial [Pseudomonas syringae group genomosp. 3]|uniref:hypothetical protein n=1 Tax=Pseudomonas syringae group genomosp. 3 TaxID=251701 RepID=UPI001C7E2D02